RRDFRDLDVTNLSGASGSVRHAAHFLRAESDHRRGAHSLRGLARVHIERHPENGSARTDFSELAPESLFRQARGTTQRLEGQNPDSLSLRVREGLARVAVGSCSELHEALSLEFSGIENLSKRGAAVRESVFQWSDIEMWVDVDKSWLFCFARGEP